MKTTSSESKEAQDERVAPAMPERHGPFGSLFFLRHLAAFVRERCPDPAEGLPGVRLHLMDGEVLDVCHVIGLAPDFVALAVYDTEREGESRAMRTELVPYEIIHRITVRSVRSAEARFGFVQERAPHRIETMAGAEVRGPEEALRAAARVVSRPESAVRERPERGASPRRERGARNAPH